MKKIIVVILILFTFNHTYAQNAQVENLVFEGAGIRGLAYSGVISELEQLGVIDNIKKVGGTSAGAITAMMVSLGYNSDEIFEIISSTKFKKFNDGEYIFIGGFSRLNSRYGWYKSEAFSKWLETIIENKTGNPDITFEELDSLGYKQLYTTGTCMNKQKLFVFSSEHYPKMKIKDAVRISMSIPLYFEAVFIDDMGKVHKDFDSEANLDIVVDGGIIGNFPIFMFDDIKRDSLNNEVRLPNYKTLGIRIDSDEQIKNDSISKELVPIPIENMSDYLQAFYVIILENLNRTPLIPEDWDRTISVSSLGISPRIKKLSDEQKQSLIESGKRSTRHFFE